MQAEELKLEKSKNIDLSLALMASEHQNKQVDSFLFSTQTDENTDGEDLSARAAYSKMTKPYISVMAKEKIITTLNEEIKYHVLAIQNLQPKHRPVDCYVHRHIKRTEKAHNTIHQALDGGSLGVLRQQAIAMR